MDAPGHVYALALEDGCFYVGHSMDVDTRVAEHFLGRGAAWTRLHAPLHVLSVQPGDESLENAQTFAFMAKYGWRNVRGGKWSSPALMSQPKPLGKALARPVPKFDPRPEEAAEPEVHLGHTVRFAASRGAVVAIVTGGKAAARCPATGAKKFYAVDVDEARRRALEWLQPPAFDGGAADVRGDEGKEAKHGSGPAEG